MPGPLDALRKTHLLFCEIGFGLRQRYHAKTQNVKPLKGKKQYRERIGQYAYKASLEFPRLALEDDRQAAARMKQSGALGLNFADLGARPQPPLIEKLSGVLASSGKFVRHSINHCNSFISMIEQFLNTRKPVFFVLVDSIGFSDTMGADVLRKSQSHGGPANIFINRLAAAGLSTVEPSRKNVHGPSLRKRPVYQGFWEFAAAPFAGFLLLNCQPPTISRRLAHGCGSQLKAIPNPPTGGPTDFTGQSIGRHQSSQYQLNIAFHCPLGPHGCGPPCPGCFSCFW